MARRERRFNVFSMSFLDVMSCGFGAVVLIFLIINHASERDTEVINTDLLAELRLLDYQVQLGEKDLFELLEDLDETQQKVAESDAQLVSTEDSIEAQKEALENLDALSVAEIESLKKLKSDIESREEELARLKSQQDDSAGSRVRAIEGEGDRQYLTGLRAGGKRVVIAVDASASMLDDNIINVLRRRHMSDDRKRRAAKWRRAVATVEWLASQLELDADFQLLTFNTELNSLISDDPMSWESVGDGVSLEKGLRELRELVPADGTSIEQLADNIRQMTPLPDNVYLIVDSLPTQNAGGARSSTVSGSDRLRLFRQARQKLPQQVPINIILFPMEGDPFASAAYWNLARVTGGAFMAPSRDWP